MPYSTHWKHERQGRPSPSICLSAAFHSHSCPVAKLCCQGYRAPLTPPPSLYTRTPIQDRNACPTLTGFEPPAGPRYRTRLGKSHYTWVTASDSLIRDSKQRIRAYYDTGFAAFPPKIHPHLPLRLALSLSHSRFPDLLRLKSLQGLSSFISVFSHEKAAQSFP